MDHGFTEIQETLNTHLGVPYFCKALVLMLYPTLKVPTHLILYYETGPMGPLQPRNMATAVGQAVVLLHGNGFY